MALRIPDLDAHSTKSVVAIPTTNVRSGTRIADYKSSGQNETDPWCSRLDNDNL